ncbi:MAG: TatD family hydrolase [Deltaproteobacteria bacterium]|nr:TatD family hydrolase [Deltaproteobacteria bacterium]
MKLFDSHCHIDDKIFNKDIDNVLNRAKKAGVHAMMVIGVTKKSSDKAVAIAETHPGVFAAVGIHPHDAGECSEKSIEHLLGLAASPGVRAWGETGLDFNRMFSPQIDQEKWFVRQVEAADHLGLPIIFHERDSRGRFLKLLAETHSNRRKGVVHCFSGNKAELTSYLDLGFYIGITGILTIKQRGEDLRRLVPNIPIDRLLIETDAPYLTPAPEKNRVRRNEPAFVRSILIKLAEVRGEEPEVIAEAIWKNSCRLFRIEEEEIPD